MLANPKCYKKRLLFKFRTVIEVFKTNVDTDSEAEKIIVTLLQFFPGARINFDLQDCDKILRVEGKAFSNEKIIKLLDQNGFYCEVLE